MSKIKLLAETDRTVTLRRADFEALVSAAEDKADLAAVREHRLHEKSVGWEAAKRDYLSRDEVERALGGESLVRIWRRKRGMNQRALAEAARVSPAYLAEIEAGKKPGSKEAVQRLAQILEVPMENLVGDDPAASRVTLQPITRSDKAAARLAKLAENGGDPQRLAEEAQAIVAEWLEIADRDGLRHQVKAAVGTFETKIRALATKWVQHSDYAHGPNAAKRMKRISDALEAAVDALDAEYDKL